MNHKVSGIIVKAPATIGCQCTVQWSLVTMSRWPFLPGLLSHDVYYVLHVALSYVGCKNRMLQPLIQFSGIDTKETNWQIVCGGVPASSAFIPHVCEWLVMGKQDEKRGNEWQTENIRIIEISGKIFCMLTCHVSCVLAILVTWHALITKVLIYYYEMLRSKNIFLLWQQQVSVLAESRLKR